MTWQSKARYEAEQRAKKAMRAERKSLLKSPYKDVSWQRLTSKWRVQIWSPTKRKVESFGDFHDIEEARQVALAARREMSA